MKRFGKREFIYVQGLGSSRAGYQTQCIDTGMILIHMIYSVLCSPLHSPCGLQWTPPKLLCLERTIYGDFRVRVRVLLRFGVWGSTHKAFEYIWEGFFKAVKKLLEGESNSKSSTAQAIYCVLSLIWRLHKFRDLELGSSV